VKSLEDQIRHVLDLEEIKKLKYLYCKYNDGGWVGQPVSHQGPSADLFTEDAVWDGRPLAYAEGREEIRKLFASFAALPMAYHAVTNPIIDIDGDTARAHWHLVGGGVGLTNASSIGLGGYEDEYVRTAEGWRIKSMRVIWGRRMITPDGWAEAVPNAVAKEPEAQV
jgi:hypothetical protein